MAKSRLSELDKAAAPKKRNDAYVMMLFITLVALGLGCVLMYMDFEEYGKQSPQKESIPALKQLGTAPPLAAPEAKKAPEDMGMGEEGKKPMDDMGKGKKKD